MLKEKTNPIKVVIVDDDRKYTEQMFDYLQNDPQIEVIATAHDGVEGITVIRMANPDVVVLDIAMPNLDGIGVLESLKRLKLGKKPKVLIVSAILNDNIAAKTITLGAEYFMLKPVDFAIIAERIRMFAKERETMGEDMNPHQYRAEKEYKRELDIESTVTEIIHKVGIPAHIKGYQYLRYAIMLVIDDLDMINCITKELYPNVAKEFNTTPSRVERAIRHAIEVAWDRGDTDKLRLQMKTA